MPYDIVPGFVDRGNDGLTNIGYGKTGVSYALGNHNDTQYL
jgi:hypothetical protein